MQLSLSNKGVPVLQKDKKYLLSCAENAAEFIKRRGSGSFLAVLLDVIEIAENRFDDENTRKQYFYEIMHNSECLKVDSLLGGGKALSNSLKAFVDFFLQTAKTSEGYIIRNKDFMDLTLDEMKYVLGWTRRLTTGKGYKKEKEEKDNTNKEQPYRDKPYKNSSRHDKPFNKNFNERQRDNQRGNQRNNRSQNKKNTYNNQELFNSAMADQLLKYYKK